MHSEKPAPKKTDLRKVKKTEIRDTVYDMIARHNYVTLYKLKEELRAKQIIDLSNPTLSSLLKQFGFK